MANELLVIGNGFDLALGMKTSFSDYFKSPFYKPIKDEIDNWVSCKKKHHNGGSINSGIEHSCWDLFFYLSFEEEKNNSPKWCDVEQAIYDSLVESNLLKWEKVFTYLNKLVVINDGWNVIKHLNNEKTLSVYLLCAYFIEFEKDQWIEWFYSKESFYRKLLKELESFEKTFGKYICRVTIDNPNFDSLWQSMTKRLVGNQNDYQIDSFNYSHIEDTRYKIRHINGDYNHPIIGIDLSEEQKRKNPEVRIFTKTSRRVHQDTQLGQNTMRNDSTMRKAFIYGHSLNKMDYDYFYYLFTLLQFNTLDISKMGTVEFMYTIYDSNKETEIQENQADAIDKLLNDFESHISPSNQHVLINLLRFSGKLKITEIPPLIPVF